MRVNPAQREMAVGEQQHGKFWPMHDLLFEHQDALEDEQLVAYAATLGIDPKWSALALIEAGFSPRARGLCERGAQRRQRHAHILHQWRALRGRHGRIARDVAGGYDRRPH